MTGQARHRPVTIASEPDSRGQIIMRQRRLSLEIRTVTVTLATALQDLDREGEISLAERVAMRREWCERASVLLQDVRARSFRIGQLTAEIGRRHGDPTLERQARAEADRLLDEAETAVAALASLA